MNYWTWDGGKQYIHDQELYYQWQWKGLSNYELVRMWRTHFVQTLAEEDQETWKSSADLFSILNVNFKPQHNETFLWVQCCKITRYENKSAKVLIGHLRVKTNEFNYREHDMWLKEQFIFRMNDVMLTTEIIKE